MGGRCRIPPIARKKRRMGHQAKSDGQRSKRIIVKVLGVTE
ncbi:MAG: hypothetical protein P4M11_12560 [Candidatus Pacebacteria bacterium]|nr:hypothetical protein [Candidatus Paceibacterota bacterium]